MAIINGNDQPNTLFGTSGSDIIKAFGGADFVNAGAGSDDIHGGSGDDDLIGGTGFNDFRGGSGSDLFIMTTRSTGGSDDLIWDFDFDLDQIDVSAWGASSFDQIKALLRSDKFGDATLNAFFNGFDHVLTIDDVRPTKLIASDFVFSTAAGGTRNGTGFDDVLLGSRFADTLSTDAGDDVLLGGIGSDALSGGSGRDDLHGGPGSDDLTGGSGFDLFVFSAASETPPGVAADLILDFQPDTDLIDVFDIDARPDQSCNQAFRWIGTTPFSAPGQLRHDLSGDTTIISGNTDSDLSAEFEILLDGSFDLVADDFIL